MPTIDSTNETQGVSVNTSALNGFAVSASNVLIGNTITSLTFYADGGSLDAGGSFRLYKNGVSTGLPSTASGGDPSISFSSLSISISLNDKITINKSAAPPNSTLEGDPDNATYNNFDSPSGGKLLRATIVYTETAVCLTESCDILTPNGYKNIRELSVGDKILNHRKEERTIKLMDIDTQKLKEAFIGMSIAEIEKDIENSKLLISSFKTPNGIHSVDLYSKTQEIEYYQTFFINT